jgi:hypothetical protein
MKAKEGGIKTHSKALYAMPETGFGRGSGGKKRLGSRTKPEEKVRDVNRYATS